MTLFGVTKQLRGGGDGRERKALALAHQRKDVFFHYPSPLKELEVLLLLSKPVQVISTNDLSLRSSFGLAFQREMWLF